MKFINESTREVKNVSNLKMRDGRIFFQVRNKGCGTKFFNNNTCLVLDEHVDDGTYLKVADGWALMDEPKVRKPRAKKSPKVATTEPEPTVEPIVTVPVYEPEPIVEPEPEPTAEPTTEPCVEEPEPTTATVVTVAALCGIEADKLKKKLAKKYGEMAEEILAAAVTLLQGAITGVTNKSEVKAIVEEVFASHATAEPKKAALVAAKAKATTTKEYYCKDYDDIKQDVADGFNVYLFGAAGSGKTHTAEQVARDLGLEYYTQTTVQFAHDVRGYGDAGGKYIGTPFYEAFTKGGLYFQDEYDRSYAEAAIVLNTALANGYYDFPVVGRVKAHPNFRFMAAGNTKMKGADESYVTGQVIDASSRDRFGAFYECEYNHDVELNAIAKGDKETVDFVEDVRKAIKSCAITHIVSYRATAYMVVRKANMAKTLVRNTFKGLETDDVRMIYNALRNKSNAWAKAMATII